MCLKLKVRKVDVESRNILFIRVGIVPVKALISGEEVGDDVLFAFDVFNVGEHVLQTKGDVREGLHVGLAQVGQGLVVGVEVERTAFEIDFKLVAREECSLALGEVGRVISFRILQPTGGEGHSLGGSPRLLLHEAGTESS